MGGSFGSSGSRLITIAFVVSTSLDMRSALMENVPSLLSFSRHFWCFVCQFVSQMIQS